MKVNTSLIVNNPISKLTELADESLKINVVIAFLTLPGLEWLDTEHYSKSEFIVGVDSGITSKSAIQHLDDNEASIHIYNNPKMFFHPKSIHFKTQNNEHIFIGSHNLTGGALNSNYELSALITKTTTNEEFFNQFEIQFDYLLNSEYCNRPDKVFYDSYNEQKLKYFKPTVKFSQRPKKTTLSKFPKESSIIKKYLKTIATEFPNVSRVRKQKIKDHPLKQINDNKFVPALSKLLQENIYKSLNFRSKLNVGGNWYAIPNVFIDHQITDDWSKITKTGYLALQIFFNDDYSKVNFAVVVQYELSKKNKSGTPPTWVQKRINRICALNELHEDYTSSLRFGYKDINVWFKPIKRYEFEMKSLPTDEILFNSIKELTKLYLASIPVD